MAKGVAGDRKAARGSKAAGRSIGPVLRLFGVAAIGCIAAGTAVLMYPRADEVPATAVRAEPAKSTASLSKMPEPVRAAAAAPAQPAPPPSGPVVQTLPPKPAAAAAPAQTASVPAPPLPTPAPAAPPAAATAYVPLPPPEPARSAAPAPAAPPPEQKTSAQFAGASVECLSPDLIAVLREVQAKFGPVTVVSGKELHTRNHSAGSARHKLHSDCKAVDFTVPGDVSGVIAFLKARPEVNGVNSYRPNGLIHIDLNERRRLATR